MRILVVEDELLIRWSIVQTLEHAGHMIIEAEDAAAAVAALQRGGTSIDAVLLDYRLPDSNDLELLSTIRKLTPHTPVILMTAYGTPEVVEGALDLGAYTVMDKPFEMGELSDLVATACATA